jgi:hypothetical protein
VAPPSTLAPVRVSPDAALISTACLVGDIIESRLAVSHPGLDGPVAFVEGVELAPLLERVAASGDLLAALRHRPCAIAGADQLRIAAWLFERGIVVGGGPAATAS